MLLFLYFFVYICYKKACQQAIDLVDNNTKKRK